MPPSVTFANFYFCNLYYLAFRSTSSQSQERQPPTVSADHLLLWFQVELHHLFQWKPYFTFTLDDKVIIFIIFLA